MARQDFGGNARTVDVRIGGLLLRQIFPLGIVALSLWLARDHFPVLNVDEIWRTVRQISPGQWTLSLIATGISFWAIGRYDSVLHGMMRTGVSPTQARHSGMSAIAIAQFAGFGIITGALVRWRLLPGLTLGQALKLSVAVSVSFLAGWAVITSGAVLIAGIDTPHAKTLSVCILSLATTLIILSVLRPLVFDKLPTLRGMGAIVALVFVDMVFASTALYVLLPDIVGTSPLLFFTVFLVALGAGLIGGTPGGVGPFELCLIALLPQIPDASILASVLVFRLVYYALPACIAVLVLLIGIRSETQDIVMKLGKPFATPHLTPKLENALWQAPWAEAGLLRQGEFSPILSGGEALAIAAKSGQHLVMLGEPIQGPHHIDETLRCLRECAGRLQRPPVVYKCHAKTALAMRQRGWSVLPVGREAWVSTVEFTTQGPKKRQLRRFLRKATKSGITVREAGRVLPLDEMAAISERWRMEHGCEKGFSMGVFEREYIRCQRVFLAYQKDRLVAFVSFHETRSEWALDLVRPDCDAPSGTIHLLIEHAIQCAATVRCDRVSLAAIPHDGDNDGRIVGWFRNRMLVRGNYGGLIRFKTSFAPHWSPLYACAPTRLSLGLALWSIYRRVNKPR